MGVTDNAVWIRLNNGDVVERPYREAVRLLSRRLAEHAEAPELETVALDADQTTTSEPPANPGPTAAEPAVEPSIEQIEPTPELLADLADGYKRDELLQMATDAGLPATGTKAELAQALASAGVFRFYADRVELSTAPVAGATPEDVPGETGSSPDGRD